MTDPANTYRPDMGRLGRGQFDGYYVNSADAPTAAEIVAFGLESVDEARKSHEAEARRHFDAYKAASLKARAIRQDPTTPDAEAEALEAEAMRHDRERERAAAKAYRALVEIDRTIVTSPRVRALRAQAALIAHQAAVEHMTAALDAIAERERLAQRLHGVTQDRRHWSTGNTTETVGIGTRWSVSQRDARAVAETFPVDLVREIAEEVAE